MTYRQGIVTGVVGALFIAAVAAGAWWILASPRTTTAADKPVPPATVTPSTLKEDQILTIKLTPDAEKRLGIETGHVEIKPTRRMRVYGGEVTVPAGGTIIVSAPLGGILKAPESGVPLAGRAVKTGDTVFLLAPLLTPESRTTLATARVDAEGKYESARTDADNKKLALDRARKLVEQQAGSKKALEEAQAAYDIALRSADAFKGQRDLLKKVAGEVDRGTAEPLPITAPENGILRAMTALPGQNVHAGASLFEVVDLRTVWIRVPIYVGELGDIAPDEPVQVGSPTARPGEPTCTAQPVVAPPSANPLAGTADLTYELVPREGALAPGQRVAVTIPQRGEEKGSTVPWSAVIHDIYGGTWVYEKTGTDDKKNTTYVRRRVQVRYVLNDLAVLASGPPAGSTIVTTGAAELFGTEVGFSK
jgi:multidrug efflux pump subunit AcrA (membrane-fusion protein)